MNIDDLIKTKPDYECADYKEWYNKRFPLDQKILLAVKFEDGEIRDYTRTNELD